MTRASDRATTVGRAFTAACGKEVRALVVPGSAAASAVCAAGLIGGPGVLPATFALTASAVVIGAWAIGHEYSGRTLPLLLTQPIARPLLLLSKTAAAAAVLTILALVAGFVLGRGLLDAGELRVFALPLLAGLTLAPALTMICRSPLAGTVFSAGILAAAWAAGGALSAFGYGPPPDARTALAAFRLAIVTRVILSLSPIAAITGWWMFLRLEAVDGGERHVSLAGWLPRAPLSATDQPPSFERRPLWQLLKKELQLQQMTVVVAALYVGLWIANEAVAWLNPGTRLLPMGIVTLSYCAMVAVLAGSLASAEERQLGTLEWQLLQPVACWQQWAVKAGTALSLTATLGLGIPVTLTLIDRSTNDLSPLSFVAIVFGACLIGLYVSSFTASGVGALLTSVLLVSVMTVVPFAVAERVSRYVFGSRYALAPGVWNALTDLSSPVRFLRWVRPTTVMLLSAATVITIWRLALNNHRRAGRGDRLIPRQALWLAAGMVCAVCVFTLVDGAVNAIARETIRAHFDALRHH